MTTARLNEIHLTYIIICSMGCYIFIYRCDEWNKRDIIRRVTNAQNINTERKEYKRDSKRHPASNYFNQKKKKKRVLYDKDYTNSLHNFYNFVRPAFTIRNLHDLKAIILMGSINIYHTLSFWYRYAERTKKKKRYTRYCGMKDVETILQ